MFFAKKKEALAIDIGSRTIKLISLIREDKKVCLGNFDIQPLPSESVNKKNIVNFSAVRDALKDLIKRNNIKGKSVAISFSGTSVFYKRTIIEQRDLVRIEKIIKEIISSDFKLKEDECRVDYRYTSKKEEKISLFVVAIKSGFIHQYTDLLTQVNLNPLVVDIDAFCLENMFRFNYPEEEKEVVLVLNFGAFVVNIAILYKGNLINVSDIEGCGDALTYEIGKRFGISFDEGEVLKISADNAELRDATEFVTPLEVSEIVRSFNTDLVERIKQETERIRSGFKKISKIYICGGASINSDLAAKLKYVYDNQEVMSINPFKNIELPKKYHNESFLESRRCLAVAVGLALRLFDEK